MSILLFNIIVIAKTQKANQAKKISGLCQNVIHVIRSSILRFIPDKKKKIIKNVRSVSRKSLQMVFDRKKTLNFKASFDRQLALQKS